MVDLCSVDKWSMNPLGTFPFEDKENVNLLFRKIISYSVILNNAITIEKYCSSNFMVLNIIFVFKTMPR